MDVLVIGSGGREYSIGRMLEKDPNVQKIYFAPGNGATSHLGENVAIKDYDDLALFAKDKNIELTIVGPEAPLTSGVVDIFSKHQLAVFGPTQRAAQLEESKVFMKDFLARHAIPTARYIQTDSIQDAYRFIETLTPPIVVKADGLCAGKGVIIATSFDEAKKTVGDMLSGKSFGDAGKKVVVEEYLDGYELSVFALTDGKNHVILPACQDHKRLLDGDQGPNTGGMGAYSPTPLVDEVLMKKIEDRIIVPTVNGMKEEGNPFTGVLFAGIMVVNNEPLTLEFNVRFGDPECEVLMPLLQTPVSELFYKGATGALDTLDVKFSDQCAVGVVMSSKNYPYSESVPAEIIVDEIVHEDIKHNTHISYAGVMRGDDEKLYASGGRVLVCVGLGDTIKQARDRAYALCGQVHFAGKHFRTDIAYQALS